MAYRTEIKKLVEGVIEESPQAVNQDKILSKVSSGYYITKQYLIRMIDELICEGKVNSKVYTVPFSGDPRIDVVASEVYYVTEKQLTSYERETLSKILRESRRSIR